MNAVVGQVPLTAKHEDAALRIIKRLLHGFSGAANVRLWNNCMHRVGDGPVAFTLVLRDPMLLRNLAGCGWGALVC